MEYNSDRNTDINLDSLVDVLLLGEEEDETAPNNRVQRTRHKVSGPLTRDVGIEEHI